MRALVVIVLLSCSCIAAAADMRFITTKGEAKVEVPPDFVKVELTLLAIGPDLAKLKQDVDQRTQQVLESASVLQIAGTDIESSGMSVEREYETDRNENETLNGFRVSRSMSVRLRAIARYEQLAKALVDAKVDSIEGVDVDVDDRSLLKQRALSEASRNAQKEARAIAAELGVQLGAPIEISEDRLFYKTPLRELADDRYEEIMVTAAKRGSMQDVAPIVLVFQPHHIEIESTVWARFEIVTKVSP